MASRLYRLGVLKGPDTTLFLLFFPILFNLSDASLNRTIDDTSGDELTGELPLYLPQTGVWKDLKCGDCVINPDIDRAYLHTYTRATHRPEEGPANLTLKFDGTAIYIYFILPKMFPDPKIITNIDCVFKLDGELVGSLQHKPDNTTTDFEYNFLAFSRSGFPAGKHNLMVSLENPASTSYINFDYAVYT